MIIASVRCQKNAGPEAAAETVNRFTVYCAMQWILTID